MVINSEPSHKYHRATLPNLREYSDDARGIRPLVVESTRRQLVCLYDDS
jgi:hypothetical protein